MITFDASEALVVLRGIARRAEDFVPFFDMVGAREVEAVQERIRYGKVTPNNDEWAPWRPMTEEIRYAKGNAGQGLLWDTGNLVSSVRFDVDGSFDLDIGTDVPNAKELQEGDGGRLVAREFLGWSRSDESRILAEVVLYLDKNILGASR